MSRILTPQQKIERSIVTDFRRDIWNKSHGDERYDTDKVWGRKIGCVISGGATLLFAKICRNIRAWT